MNVVFDTNVLIPLALKSSRSTILLDRLTNGGHRVVLSPSLYAEVREKLLGKPSLRQWLKMTDEEIRQFLDRLPSLCLEILGEVEVHGVVTDDPNDDHVLAAAWEGQANYLVTEDRHLLSLGSWQGIEILTRESLLNELDRRERP